MPIIHETDRDFIFQRLKKGMFLQARNQLSGRIVVFYYVLEKSESRATLVSYALSVNKLTTHEMNHSDWNNINNVWRTSEPVTKSEYKQKYVEKLFENL